MGRKGFEDHLELKDPQEEGLGQFIGNVLLNLYNTEAIISCGGSARAKQVSAPKLTGSRINEAVSLPWTDSLSEISHLEQNS